MVASMMERANAKKQINLALPGEACIWYCSGDIIAINLDENMGVNYRFRIFYERSNALNYDETNHTERPISY